MDNVREVITAGADGVAVIYSVVGSKNITAAAQELRKRISDSKAELRT
jgi:thiamine monophosphate synthase